MPTIQDPLKIGTANLSNRLVLPPITTRYADEEGHVTERLLGFYRQRARHVGLVVVEAAAMRADGRIAPHSLGAWSDEHVPGLTRLAGAIKAEGAAAFVQINHAGARSVPVAEGVKGAAPSDVAFRADVVPTSLSQKQITELVAAYAAAARRAQGAGFDGVEAGAATHPDQPVGGEVGGESGASAHRGHAGLRFDVGKDEVPHGPEFSQPVRRRSARACRMRSSPWPPLDSA